jgi:hypothetical protein
VKRLCAYVEGKNCDSGSEGAYEDEEDENSYSKGMSTSIDYSELELV